ncbi:cellulose synthase [Sphingomonas koreensis]|nr:cellulose synthase [Sphingomonas koreensis]
MKRSLKRLGLIALVLMALPSAAVGQSVGVDALLNQARYWQAKGRRDLAGQAYRRVLQVDPGNAAARQGLSATNTRAPAPRPVPTAKAPNAPRSATISAPVSARVAVPSPVDRGGDARAAGFRALDSGDLNAAARSFNAALSARPRDADALGGLGLVRLRGSQFDEARDLLTRAAKLGNASRWSQALAAASFYADLGDAQKAYDAGNLPDAEAKASQLAGSSFTDRAPALQLLAQIYQQEGRYGGAGDLFRQAAAIGVGKGAGDLQAQAIHAQAMQAAASGNAALANQLFGRAIATDGENAWLRYDYARFLTQQGNRAEASAQIAALSQTSDPQALFAAALLSRDAGQPLQAEALLARIPERQRTPDIANLLLTLKADQAIDRARTMRRQGQVASASASLEQLSQTPGLSAGARAQLAGALLEFGDTGGAASIAQAIPLDEIKDVGNIDPLVRVLAATGQDAQAYAALQRAQTLAGGAATDQQKVAQLGGVLVAGQADRLRQSGQLAQAFDLLQRQWTQGPGSPDILAALGRLYQTGRLYPQAQQTFQLVLAQQPGNVGALIGVMDSAASAGDRDTAKRAMDQAIRVAPANHEVYLAAARVEQARGDEKAAYRDLQRARELYLHQSGVTAGGFLASNPFAAAQGGNPYSAAATPAAVNPFALGSTPPAPYAPQGGYAASPYPASSPYPAGPGSYTAASGVYPSQAGYPTGTVGLPPATGIVSPSQVPDGANTPYAASGPAVPSDPVLAGIQRDMQALSQDSGVRVDADTQYRQRSGETGLSRLRELGGSATVSTDIAGGRISGKAEAVVVDAGRPTGSALARFGRNPTSEAQAIVAQQPSQLAQAATQHASGVALSASYEGKTVQADVGTTPLGFEKTNVVGGVSITPHLSPHSTIKLHAERRPVTDSVVSYAGTRDPVTGALWGAVIKSGGGASYSYDKDGTGFYADAAYHHFDGFNVVANNQLEANVGGYLPVMRDAKSSLTLGVNANYQAYDNNQNFFTFGQGGYFSPQSFLSISFPVRYQSQQRGLSIDANVAPGYQSYDQRASPLYPTDPAAQAELDSLKGRDNDVRSFFDSISKTGFGLAGSGSAYYAVRDGTRIGGEVDYNSFGDYNEFKAMIGIRHSLGEGR